MPRSGFTVDSYVKRRRRKNTRKARALAAPMPVPEVPWTRKLPRQNTDADYKYGTVTTEHLIVSPPAVSSTFIPSLPPVAEEGNVNALLSSMPQPPRFVPPTPLSPTGPAYSHDNDSTPAPTVFTCFDCKLEYNLSPNSYANNFLCNDCELRALDEDPEDGIEESDHSNGEDNYPNFVDLTGSPGDSPSDPITLE